MTKKLAVILVSLVLAIAVVGCATEEDSAVYPTGMTIISIPDGQFYMGSMSNPEYPEEEPIHTVFVDSFQMSQAEVTNAQYVQFLNEAKEDGTVYATTSEVYGAMGNYVGKLYLDIAGEAEGQGNILNASHIVYDGTTFSVEDGYENWPVVFVSWYGAQAFTDHFIELDGKNMRLPTEAEWEYVAQGSLGYLYPTEDGLIGCENANYECETPVGQLTEVDSYPRNPFGLSDLAGNVSEWCTDWYDEEFYSVSLADNPVNLYGYDPPQDGTATGGEGEPYNYDTKVVRGGSYQSSEDTQRASFRGQDYPFNLNSHTGFRVVIED